jgi:hypothetical protein
MSRGVVDLQTVQEPQPAELCWFARAEGPVARTVAQGPRYRSKDRRDSGNVEAGRSHDSHSQGRLAFRLSYCWWQTGIQSMEHCSYSEYAAHSVLRQTELEVQKSRHWALLMTICFGIQRHGAHPRDHLGRQLKTAAHLKRNQCCHRSGNHLQTLAGALISLYLQLQEESHRQTNQNQLNIFIISWHREVKLKLESIRRTPYLL